MRKLSFAIAVVSLVVGAVAGHAKVSASATVADAAKAEAVRSAPFDLAANLKEASVQAVAHRQ